MSELDKELLAQLARTRAPGCPSTAELGRYLDGDAEPELAQRIEAHLRACPACINELIDLRELARLAREGEPAPASLVAKLDALKTARLGGNASAGGELPDAPAARNASSTGARRRGAASGRERTARRGRWRTRLAPRYLAAAAVVAFVALVGVAVLQQVPTGPTGLVPRGGFSPERLASARAAVAAIRGQGARAAGAAVGPNAVVTLASAIGDGDTLTVELDGSVQPGRVVYRDAAADLALIHIDAAAGAPLTLADPANLTSGTPLVVLEPADAAPLTGQLGARGPARWQNDAGAAHAATLLTIENTPTPALAGAPVLTDALEVAGLYAFREDGVDHAIAADTLRDFLAAAAAQ